MNGCIGPGKESHCGRSVYVKKTQLCRQHTRQHLAGGPLKIIGAYGRKCEFPDCGRKHFGRGLCKGHYQQAAKGQELRPLRAPRRGRTPCSGPGLDGPCGRPANRRGLCEAHHRQKEAGKELAPVLPRSTGICTGPECDRKAGRYGHCRTHRAQVATGRPLAPIQPQGKRLGTCSECGAGPLRAKGLCRPCYRKAWGAAQPKVPKVAKPKPVKPKAAKPKAPKPKPPKPVHPPYVPGTLTHLHRRAGAASRPNTGPIGLLPFTDVTIPEDTAAAAYAVLESFDALDIADMLGLAS